MPLTRRYRPEHSSGTEANYGMDFAAVIPPGIGIVSGTLSIFTNTNPPQVADAFWSKEQLYIRGAAVYCIMSLAPSPPQPNATGMDFLFNWDVIDSRGSHWSRTVALLVAPTS